MARGDRRPRALAGGGVEWHPTIKDLPASERPRERLLAHGATALSTPELLAVVLRAGTARRTVTKMAEDLLAAFGGLGGLARASTADLCRQRGMGPAKAAQLKAALELARRFQIEQPEERLQIRSPSDAAHLLQLEMAALEQEQLRVILLDSKNRLLAVRRLYEGSINAAQVRIGEIFREAVRENCAALVVVHNHPSGDPTPSPEDLRLTEAMVAAGRLLDIDVLDHVIIGHGRWVSMRERGAGFGPR